MTITREMLEKLRDRYEAEYTERVAPYAETLGADGQLPTVLKAKWQLCSELLEVMGEETGTMGEIEIGGRVQAGNGEDHDTGRVLDTVEAGKVYDDDGVSTLAREPMALVAWEGGACKTWHPVSKLESAP